jgi:hypothetical protein
MERGDLDVLEGPPRPTPVDDLGLVEAVDGLGQRVVVAVADAADGRLDPGFGRPLGVFYGHLLASPVAVTHQAGAADGD